MITITVNGKLDWTGKNKEAASRRIDQIIKVDPTAVIELWNGGKSKLRVQPSTVDELIEAVGDNLGGARTRLRAALDRE